MQELALFPELSISETMRYFGRIAGLKSSQLKEHMDFLLGFLDLPDKSRIIRTLRSVGRVHKSTLHAQSTAERQHKTQKKEDSFVHSPPCFGSEPTLAQIFLQCDTAAACQFAIPKSNGDRRAFVNNKKT